VYLGANAENASYSLTVCAERAALFAALSNGEREFEAIAVLGGKDAEISDFCPPCGACRQALAEFSRDGSLKVITTDGNDVRALPLAKLLPESFSL
jgi:cytidine deaminase